MEKKIGMLSFHESLSYGATLQCFALQTVLKEMGYNTEFIDFQREKSTDQKKIRQDFSTKTFLKNVVIQLALRLQNIIQAKNNALVEKAFKDFKQEYISVGSEQLCSIDELYAANLDYNIYLTGSDQVWNPYNSILEVYGLGFVPENINTIAYAASIGVSEIPFERKEYMYDAIHKVKHISCREYEGAKALTELLGRNVDNVLDPTLLLSKEEWNKYESRRQTPDKYVLCFFLGSLEYPRKIARELAKRNGCKMIVIPGSPKDAFIKGGLAKGCGPSDFLKLFHDATFICTDSFHGTAFSVNYNKPFYSFCRRGYNDKTSYLSRIRDLLDILGLSERLIYPNSKVEYYIPLMDYSFANSVLEDERTKSMDFLNNALSDIEG